MDPAGVRWRGLRTPDRLHVRGAQRAPAQARGGFSGPLTVIAGPRPVGVTIANRNNDRSAKRTTSPEERLAPAHAGCPCTKRKSAQRGLGTLKMPGLQRLTEARPPSVTATVPPPCSSLREFSAANTACEVNFVGALSRSNSHQAPARSSSPKGGSTKRMVRFRVATRPEGSIVTQSRPRETERCVYEAAIGRSVSMRVLTTLNYLSRERRLFGKSVFLMPN